MLAFFAGAGIRFMQWEGSASELVLNQLPGAVLFMVVVMACMAALGMYQPDAKQDAESILLKLLPSLAMGFAVMTFIFYLFPDIYLGRGLLAIVMLLVLLLILLERILVFRWSGLDHLRSKALVLGVGGSAKELFDLVEENTALQNIKIVGFVPFTDEERSVPAATIIPKTSTLLSLADRYMVREIIVATQERRGGTFPIQELLECKICGIKVTDITGFFERECNHLRWILFIQAGWFLVVVLIRVRFEPSSNEHLI